MTIILAALLAAQPVPPPGWDIGNTCAKDVATERPGLESEIAAYRFCRALESEEGEYRSFIRLFCNDSLYAIIADDRPGLSSETVVAERQQICAEGNRP